MSEIRQAAINPDGSLAYTSVSAVKKYLACPSAWWFRYKLRLPDPQGAGAALGEKYHAQVEHYLKTGENVLDDVPLTAMRGGLFPAPGKPGPYLNRLKDGTTRSLDIMVEQNFGQGGFELTSEGVPFKGFIDLVNPRRLKTDGVVEIIDWKFKGDIVKYGVEREALIDPSDEDGLQMVGYAMALCNADMSRPLGPAVQVQLSHGHVQTKKGKREATYPFRRIDAPKLYLGHVPELWDTVAPTVRAMKDVARETDVAKVEGKNSACWKYGGCAYRAQCPHFNSGKPEARAARMAELFKSSKRDVPPVTYTTEVPTEVPTEGAKQMGMLSKLTKTTPATPAAVLTSPAAPQAPAATPPAAPPKRQLIEDQSTGNDVELRIARAVLDSAARLGIQPAPSAVATLAAVLPPDAPKPQAAQAPAQAPTAPAEVVTFAKPIPEQSAPASTEPRRRGRPPKTATAPAEELKDAVIRTNGTEISVDGVTAKSLTIEHAAAGFSIYIGCSPRKAKATSLHPYIDALEAQALAGFKEHLKLDVDDIRLSTGSDVGFGKWAAVLAKMAKDAPPAPGNYTVIGLGDARVEAVVSALTGLAVEVVQ